MGPETLFVTPEALFGDGGQLVQPDLGYAGLARVRFRDLREGNVIYAIAVPVEEGGGGLGEPFTAQLVEGVLVQRAKADDCGWSMSPGTLGDQVQVAVLTKEFDLELLGDDPLPGVVLYEPETSSSE